MLSWSSDNLRDLPWRKTRDPWAVLVAEVMLQQTQVDRVIERWTRFLARFPTARVCASSPRAAVIDEWAGLGYNRRAVFLHRAAGEIVERHGGELPAGLDELLALPGVGAYTSRAVAVFAFEDDAAIVDTNVGRVLARWIGHPLTARQAQEAADDLVPTGRSWLWNQTLLDFAAMQCVRRAPECSLCCVREACAWRGDGADPADGSAGVSRGQARFEGSVRQVRGRVVDALRAGPLTWAEVEKLGRSNDDADGIRTIVAGLERDGLVRTTEQGVELPLGGDEDLHSLRG